MKRKPAILILVLTVLASLFAFSTAFAVEDGTVTQEMMNAYCIRHGHAKAVLFQHNAYGWKCKDLDGRLSDLHIDELCQDVFKGGSPTYNTKNFSDPDTWKCHNIPQSAVVSTNVPRRTAVPVTKVPVTKIPVVTSTPVAVSTAPVAVTEIPAGCKIYPLHQWVTGRLTAGPFNYLRDNAGTSASQIGEVTHEYSFVVIGKNPVCADGMQWYNINYKGTKGWLAVTSADGQSIWAYEEPAIEPTASG